MNPKVNPPQISFEPSDYTRLSQIFHSWFWRFYDHLLYLILCNLSWFLTCFGIGLAVWYRGLLGNPGRVNFFNAYLLFVVESMVSIGWAFLIFKIFNEDRAPLSDVWQGIQKYFIKAMGVSAISGLVTGLAIYNFQFYYHLQSSHRFYHLLLLGFVFWILLFWISATLYQWPILFFQNPPFLKIFYRSFLLVLGNGLFSLGLLVFYAACFFLFTLSGFLWFFIGVVFFFSFQCVVLEKKYLKYKITYGDKPLEPFLANLDNERQRGWRDFLRPWENR